MYAEDEIWGILRQDLPLPAYQIKRLADLLRKNRVDPFDLGGISRMEEKFPELCSGLRSLHLAIRPDLMRLKAAEQSVRDLKKRSSEAGDSEIGGYRPSLCQEMWWEWGVIFPPFAFSIPTKLKDEREVRAAIIHVLELFPVLRSSFAVEEGVLKLSLNRSEEFVLEHPRDRAGPRYTGPEAPLHASREWGAPIANSDRWQARIRAILDEEAQYTLDFNIGHLIFDDASIGILVRKVGEIFGKLSQTGVAPYPACDTYFRLARRERDWIDKGEGDALLEYWRAALKDIPVLTTPSGRRLEHWQRGLSAHCSVNFDRSVRQRLAAGARITKVSILIIVFYLLSRAASRWARTDLIVIRSLRNKRNSLETIDLVGFWTAVDIVPVRGLDRPAAQVIRDIALALDCARRLNLPQQPGEWLRLQNTIPVTLNYMVDASSAHPTTALQSHRGSMKSHMSSPEQAEKPNIVVSVRDSGEIMGATIIFSGASGDCQDENALVDLILEEFTQFNLGE